MNYGELTKAYPEFKIPYHKYTQYYIDTLMDAGLVTERPIKLLEDLEMTNPDANKYKITSPDTSKYKMQAMDRVLNYFLEQGWNLSSDIDLDRFDTDYTELDFNNYKKDKYYISIDLRQANWQAFKFAFGLTLPTFEEWVQTELSVHPFYAESKSWRQLVFGNTNPKRLQRIQRYMMGKLVNKLTTEMRGNIVARRSDELLLELNYLPIVHSFMFGMLSSWAEMQVKVSCFQVEEVMSMGDCIKVKHFQQLDGHSIPPARMMSVPGNKFFMHLKNIILKKPILERDLYFEQDRRLAMWVV